MRNVPVWLVGLVAFGAVATPGFGEEVVSKIAGISAWYRADRVVRGPDNTLTSLIDGSGNGRDLVPGPKPPQIVAGVVNGKPVLRFDGKESPLVDDRHDWSAKGFTAFVVASFDQIVEKPDIHDNPYYRVPVQRDGRQCHVQLPAKEAHHAGGRPLGRSVSCVDDGVGL